MRGSTTFQSLFNDLPPIADRQEGKGRSAELNAKRDELVLCRYLFYGHHTPYRYELILCKLSEEFFLSERRITDIIAEHSVSLHRLRQNFPTLGYLRNSYPHLVWRAIEVPVKAKFVAAL